MNKYKVEFVETITTIIDVLAKDQNKAIEKATKKWQELSNNGTLHYNEIKSDVVLGDVYDVTNTDDPFDA